MVKHAYAVGRIRSLETQLLDESRLHRLIDAADFNAAYLVLREIPFHSAEIDKLETFDLEKLLKNELEATKELLDSFAPKDELLAAMWRRHADDLSLADYLSLLEKSAADGGSQLFSRYAAAFSDLNRIKLAMLAGEKDPETVIERYRYSDYARPVAVGLEEYKQSGSLFALEREIDDHLMLIMRRAKYIVFGIEPLLGYFFAREMEIKMLRLILTGKLLQIKPELLRERRRLTYV